MLYRKPSPSRKIQPLDVLFDEGFTHKGFQTDQMINCTPFAPEATLKVCNKTIAFQKPYQAGINHTFYLLQRQLARPIGR